MNNTIAKGRKMKEWIFNNGYFINSGPNSDIKEYAYCASLKLKGDSNVHLFWEHFIKPTEIESVTKVFLWVWNKEKK